MRTLIIPIGGTVIRDTASRHRMLQSLFCNLVHSHYGISPKDVAESISHVKRIEENIRRNGRIMGFKKKIKILTYLLQQKGFPHIHMGRIGYLWTLSYFYHPPLIDIGMLQALKHLQHSGVRIFIVAEASDLSVGATRRLVQRLELPLEYAFVFGDGEPSVENPMAFKKVLRRIQNHHSDRLVGIASDISVARAMIHAGIPEVALTNGRSGQTILESLREPGDIMRFVLGTAKI